jgi:hypothetical protein
MTNRARPAFVSVQETSASGKIEQPRQTAAAAIPAMGTPDKFPAGLHIWTNFAHVWLC